MKRKFLAMLMALAMIIGMVPMTALAAEEECPAILAHAFLKPGVQCKCCDYVAPSEDDSDDSTDEQPDEDVKLPVIIIPTPEQPDEDEEDEECEAILAHKWLKPGQKCACCDFVGQAASDDDTSDDSADVAPETPDVEEECEAILAHKWLKPGQKCACCDYVAPPADDSAEQPDADVDPNAHKCMAETEAVANKDGLSHSIVCAECGEFWKNEAHDWEDGVCTVCGFESPFSTAPEQPEEDEHKCMAETKAIANKDGLSHSIVCAECGEFWKNEAHNWTSLKDGEWFCLDCGTFTTKNPNAEEHACVAGKKPANNGDGTHSYKCECGEVVSTEAHNWTSLKDGEWFCKDCGVFTTEDPNAEEHECVAGKKPANNGDGTHSYKCECGEVVSTEAHNWTSLKDGEWFCKDCGVFTTEDPNAPECDHAHKKYVDNGNGSHDVVCKECNEVLTDDAAHTYHRWGKCVCGAKKPAPCKHENKDIVDNGDGTHDVVCEKCEKVLTDNAAHTYHRWGKCVCGATKSHVKPVRPGKPVRPSKPEEDKVVDVVVPSNPNAGAEENYPELIVPDQDKDEVTESVPATPVTPATPSNPYFAMLQHLLFLIKATMGC